MPTNKTEISAGYRLPPLFFLPPHARLNGEKHGYVPIKVVATALQQCGPQLQTLVCVRRSFACCSVSSAHHAKKKARVGFPFSLGSTSSNLTVLRPRPWRLYSRSVKSCKLFRTPPGPTTLRSLTQVATDDQICLRPRPLLALTLYPISHLALVYPAYVHLPPFFPFPSSLN